MTKPPRKPQDHLPARPVTYTATINGVEYESLPLAQVFKGGFFRRIRKLDEMDQAYTMVEAAFEGVEGFFDAFDELTLSEQRPVWEGLGEALGATVGEFSGSST